MTTTLFLIRRAAAASSSSCLSVFHSSRRTGVTTDIGTLDKEKAEKVFPPSRPYSPYAGRNFPTRPLFGDTHLHTGVLDGRRRLRRPARPAGRLSLRRGEEIIGVERPARRSSRARSTSSWSPTTRTTWASFPTSSPASPSCSPTRRAASGTT